MSTLGALFKAFTPFAVAVGTMYYAGLLDTQHPP
jgi:hypothetical protein